MTCPPCDRGQRKLSVNSGKTGSYPYFGLWGCFHREIRHDSLAEGKWN